MNITLAAALTAVSAFLGAEITYFNDVKPILDAECVQCHRPAGDDIMGMVAPMPLQTYEETRPRGQGDCARR